MASTDTGLATRPIRVFLGLGANLGEPLPALHQAIEKLKALPGVQHVQSSHFYSTAPVQSSGPDYVNAVVRLETELTAHALLRALQAIERDHGRERPYRNAPRTLDLDILLYGDAQIHDDELIVPHPRMHQRAFVLAPLAELEPQLTLYGKTLGQWLAACSDQRVQRMNPA